MSEAANQWIKVSNSLVKRCFSRVKIHASEVMTERELEGDVERAGGDVVCQVCGLKYYEHPQIMEHPELHLTCEWKVYKL